jgi:ABC-type polysaccharide transport system permease subunit
MIHFIFTVIVVAFVLHLLGTDTGRPWACVWIVVSGVESVVHIAHGVNDWPDLLAQVVWVSVGVLGLLYLIGAYRLRSPFEERRRVQ